MLKNTAPSVHHVPIRDDYDTPANATSYAAAIQPGLTYDPFDHIASLGYDLIHADLPLEILGLTDFHARTVTVGDWLLPHEARATAAHEVVHIERGPLAHATRNVTRALTADDGRPIPVQAAEEAACDALAAARLLPFEHLVQAARGVDSPEELAEAAGVDRSLLLVRLGQLSRWEHDQVLRVTQYAEHGSRLRRHTPLRRARSSKIRQPLPW